MVEKYYVDTCVWRDFYENRVGFNGRPLGGIASAFFMWVLSEKKQLLISELTLRELKKDYGEDEIIELFSVWRRVKNLIVAGVSRQEIEEARVLSSKRNISFGDCLHAVVARNNGAILVTQNMRDFNVLADIVIAKKPEHVR